MEPVDRSSGAAGDCSSVDLLEVSVMLATFVEGFGMRYRSASRAAWVALALMSVGLASLVTGVSAFASSPPHPRVTLVGSPAPNPRHLRPFPGKRRKGLGQIGGCPDVAGGICDYTLVNDTPYVMKLVYSRAFFTDLGKTYDTPFDIAPSATLEPGQKTRFQLSQGQAWYSWTMANIHYTFTDVNGGLHRCDYNVDANGNPYTYSFDVSADGSLHPSTAFHMAFDPDGNQNDIDAVLSHPAVATIDAQKQAAEAEAVMKLWPQGTNKNFTPTTGLSFNTGPFHRVSALVYNASNENASLTLTGSDTEDETTSIGLKLGWSTSLDILGIADQKISASITGGHSWTSGVTVSDSDQVQIKPGWEGWIESAVTSATVTGNFSFTTPQGITYNVLGASVTEPGFGPHGTNGAITFEPNGRPFSPTAGSKRMDLDHRLLASSKPHINRTRARSRCASYRGRVGKTRGCVHWLTNVGDGTVVIDAKADPKAAAAAMALWDAATNKSFVPTSNPIYTNTDQTIVSQYYRTPPGWSTPSTGTLTAEQRSSSSWSLGGSVGAETTLSALGFANASVSVEFTAEHQWVTSHSDSQAISVTVDPGYVGWIEGYDHQVSLTGDYAFTVNGVTYQVNNLTITEQGNASDGPPTAAYTYIVKEQKQSSLGLRNHLPPSRGPAKNLAGLVQNPKALI
jgi:hypothetical protein